MTGESEHVVQGAGCFAVEGGNLFRGSVDAFSYRGDLHEVVGNEDVLVHGQYVASTSHALKAEPLQCMSGLIFLRELVEILHELLTLSSWVAGG